ncbi:hypothetical protein Trco_001770 [Trichoderma cornu-damae]|uniref:Ankyrin n=1 Tax=Trichoderma cornu-damae TaxID=654480 RepID=A0A9P8TYI4_9HYPO|nr:hypothetical protein Trco_001770 [Trichoderma cornu-damae]
MHVLRLLVEKFAVNVNELDDSKESALFCAARGNNWWVVHQALPYLLDAGADIHVRNVQGQTPLHMALEGDSNWPGPYNWDAAKILIGRGADVNAVDGKGRSCLACAQHNVDMVKLLIKHGATVTVDSIFAAIDSGNAQVVEALLSGGMDPNTGRDGPPEPSSGMTGRGHKEPDVMLPLYHAAMKLNRPWRFVDKDHQEIAQRAKVVQVLLGHGADPFAKFLKRDAHAEEGQGYRECTLLHEVLFAGKLADEFLQLSDLDVNHRDAKGRTLLHMVCESSNGPDYIIGSYAKNPAGVRKERVHTFQRLLSLGAELKAQDDFGRNILHYMFIGEVNIGSSTYEKLLAYTLDKAPDLSNQADGNGETPLHYAAIRAVSNNNADEVRMLLDAGADPTAVNKKGDTMLHILGRGLAIAVLRNSFQDLVGRGVDINARNDRGETALFSFYGLPKAGRNSRHHSHGVDTPTAKHAKPMLEKLGGDFLVTDSQGRGLLHAAASGDVERFQELMDMGLDPMMEDYAQQTAIDKAAACGNRDILELFEKKDEGNPSSLLGT